MKLVTSNSPDDIKRVTRDAFKMYSESTTTTTATPIITPTLNTVAPPTASSPTLCSLKGIGPATASLLLSVYDPAAVPFFSDEAFRWIMYAPGEGQNWDRPIKYDAKTYHAYFEGVQALRARLELDGQRPSASDVERVGFVLGKEAETGRMGAFNKGE